MTAADVAPPPPGDAVGSLFAGTYGLTAFHVDGCHCRSGGVAFCLSLMAAGQEVRVTQTDGRVMLGDATGAVDANGNFVATQRAPLTDPISGQPSGESFANSRGAFARAGASGMVLGVTSDATVAGTLNGSPIDCDVRTAARAVRVQGP